MANTFVPRQISSPHLLNSVAPKVLYKFLKKYEAFFRDQKVMPSSSRDIDYDPLSIVLKSPSEDWPPKLMADLLYWDEVAEMGVMEDLIEIAEQHSVNISDKATIAEAALQIRMAAPEDLEDLHSQYRAHDMLKKKKRFLSFFAKPPVLPKWKRPTPRQLKAIADDLDMWYETQKKGRGTRLTVVEKKDAAWFIIRHGGTFKRENIIKDGEPDMAFFRPEAYDLIIYYYKQGELAIYNDGNSTKERRAYCVHLGKHLFQDPDFFEQTNARKFSLEPLRTKGRNALDCSEIDGLNSARLCQLRFRFPGTNDHKITHAAEDVFAGLEYLDEPIPVDAELIYMGIKMTPSDGIGGERTVKLYYPNISVYDHESDAEIAHHFLSEQGFILPRPGARR